ncbi:transcription termination factor NusA [Ruminococcus sp. 210702-SL.1.03]|jgi:N utilization substance protein A|uniref:transcription termination factor NusA n=1 Tax=Ruminococcus sp. 210702-SL.1.03 TaxID=2883233 RepID=UPI001D066154|nr:transcription termination factor NusA [Ruminococcus sp. 210702-SL.1.03]MCB6615902.1 transcription termination factor NusA [Ruminococcus sp. 210702-SL.1.03]
MIVKMNGEFFEALKLMGQENGMEPDALAEIIKQGVAKAIKRDNPNCENIRVEINPETGVFEMGVLKVVVDDEPLDEYNEINIDEARTIDPNARVGGMCLIEVSPATFGRVAVQNAKQQIKHELKNHERERLIEQFNDKLYECVTAKVERIEARTGNAVLSLDKSEVYLVRQEQIPGEILRPGDMIKVYVVGIANPEKKPALKISRTHKDLVKRLFENEVPEIAEGVVEVMGISRVAGSRSKLAVRSKDKNVDAIGACIGPKKSRISAVVNELCGEKIDIIPYSEDPAEYIARALAPAQVIDVELIEGSEVPACRVIVPANQLSLAIGNRGQNARLAAGLTGYKIDIISDAQAKELEEAAEAEQEEKALEGENEVSELELADALEEVPAEGESEV